MKWHTLAAVLLLRVAPAVLRELADRGKLPLPVADRAEQVAAVAREVLASRR